MKKYETLLIEKNDGVTTVRLNRLEAQAAVESESAHQWTQAMKAALQSVAHALIETNPG